MSDHPVVMWLDGLVRSGLSVSDVVIEEVDGRWRVRASVNTWLPLGEGGALSAHSVQVDHAATPPGVTIAGYDRWPDEIICLPPGTNDEQAETLIREIAALGGAGDWAKIGPHWYLTKPRGPRWYQGGPK